ncbi:MAG: cysteine protease [Caulobacter sp.]|nr:cysteine protease [Caulobacter sp.]
MNFGSSLKMGFGALALLLAASVNAQAAPAFMSEGAVVAPPPGFAALCEREPDSCGAPAGAQSQALALTSPTFATSSLGGLAVAHPEIDRAEDGLTLISVDGLRAARPASERTIAAVPAVMVENDAWTVVAAPAAQPTPAPVAKRLSKNQMALINRINRDVNREVNKANDFDLYGLLEYWTTPLVVNGKMYGDCEDYALEKRRRLIAAGVSATDLSMAVAVTARGESHAVLVVAFDEGDMVLDNLTPWATPWTALNYRWLQRQVAGSMEWATIL